MAGSNLVIKLTPLVKSLLPSPANPGLETVSEVRCGTKTDPCRPKKSMKSWLMGRLQCSVSRLERRPAWPFRYSTDCARVAFGDLIPACAQKRAPVFRPGLRPAVDGRA